ncbi:MAG: sel1 repeat family protein [Nitrosomonadales bacterium]|nr:sel1 repeat family protein [Nitrosomonadales bacterium]
MTAIPIQLKNQARHIFFGLATAITFSAINTNAHAGLPEAKAAYQRKDFDTAEKELESLVAQGIPEAEFLVAQMFENGEGVQQNNMEAMSWYHKAASHGYAPAQNNLGWLYEKGTGIGSPLSYPEAAKWYGKAAEQGYAIAQYNLGLLYYIGKNNFPRNFKAAAAWYTKAADQGMVAAQLALGNMYENGIGVHSLVQAYKWYSLAASAGNEAGKTNKKLVEKKLDPDLLQEAQDLVQEWQANHK